MADAPWRDEDTLRELYHGERLSIQGIADELGATYPTVHKWLSEHGIERRSSGEHQTPPELQDREWLEEQHVTLERPMVDIGEEVGVHRATVSRWLKRHGIERNSGNTLSPDAEEVLTDEEELREMYEGAEMSQLDIALELDCSQQTVDAWMSRHGIESRPMSFYSGEKAPNWNGGYDTYYGASWKEQRAKRLIQDGYTCQRCGLTDKQQRKDIGIGLDVHHVIPFKDHDTHEEANKLSNLVSLCRACHIQMEGLPIDTN